MDLKHLEELSKTYSIDRDGEVFFTCMRTRDKSGKFSRISKTMCDKCFCEMDKPCPHKEDVDYEATCFRLLKEYESLNNLFISTTQSFGLEYVQYVKSGDTDVISKARERLFGLIRSNYDELCRLEAELDAKWPEEPERPF